MRAVVFFENVVANEAVMYAEQWPNAIAMMAFNSQGLSPYALVSGIPAMQPESTQVNFGTEEAPVVSTVVRMMFELPDIKSDDVLLVFAGSRVKEISSTPDAEFTEDQLNYYTVVCNLFGSTQYQLQGEMPAELQFQSFTPLAGVEESRQYALTALLKDIKVEGVEQVYVPAIDLVKQALELGLPMPPGFDAQAYLDAQPSTQESEAAPAVTDQVESVTIQ